MSNLGINRIYRMKEIHVRVDEFLQCAMKTIKLKRLQNTSTQVGLAIAIEQGHVEVITHYVEQIQASSTTSKLNT
ncbi:unnamed protein product [Prunus armeniaca]|uniref:Uncharacterized protein n=1 Tax=Prunus armeniaca TaxID=36596 RepID=A0A6J5VNK2_PRUAR|nr:unnamed protein product [Prunus armeniaca]